MKSVAYAAKSVKIGCVPHLRLAVRHNLPACPAEMLDRPGEAREHGSDTVRELFAGAGERGTA